MDMLPWRWNLIFPKIFQKQMLHMLSRWWFSSTMWIWGHERLLLHCIIPWYTRFNHIYSQSIMILFQKFILWEMQRSNNQKFTRKTNLLFLHHGIVHMSKKSNKKNNAWWSQGFKGHRKKNIHFLSYWIQTALEKSLFPILLNPDFSILVKNPKLVGELL